MADSESTTEEEQQLQRQIEGIYLDYQKALENSQAMAPKEINTKKVGSENNEGEIDDDDLDGSYSIFHFERPSHKPINHLIIE